MVSNDDQQKVPELLAALCWRIISLRKGIDIRYSVGVQVTKDTI